MDAKEFAGSGLLDFSGDWCGRGDGSGHCSSGSTGYGCGSVCGWDNGFMDSCGRGQGMGDGFMDGRGYGYGASEWSGGVVW